ncbi:MAG: hypothetical protein IPM01_29730 [Burkholderiaceae bacterium]|nr:hypothetical protein [Burkholderiaceae bacterium]
MKKHLDWKQTVSPVTSEVRQQYALMQPIIPALEQIPPRKWSWRNPVVAMVSGK